MDFAELKTLLISSIRATLPGVPVSWSGDPQEFQLKLPYRVEIDGPTSIVTPGLRDVVKYTDASAGYLSAEVVAHREATVTIRAVSRDNTGASQAEFGLERVKVGLRWPSVRQPMIDAGLAILAMGPSVAYPAVFDGRRQSIAAFELRVGFVLTFDDATDPALSGTLETVDLYTKTSEDPASGPLHLPEV